MTSYRDAVNELVFEVEAAFKAGESACIVSIMETECVVTEDEWPEFKAQLIKDMRETLN